MRRTEPPKPPSDLGPAGQAEWQALTAAYDFDPTELSLLKSVCVCVDRAENAAQVAAAEGQFRPGRFDRIEEHPSGDVERKWRELYRKMRREMNLDISTESPRAPRRA